MKIVTCVIFVFTERGKYRLLKSNGQSDKWLFVYWASVPYNTYSFTSSTLSPLPSLLLLLLLRTSNTSPLGSKKENSIHDHLPTRLLSNSLRLNLYLYVIICWDLTTTTKSTVITSLFFFVFLSLSSAPRWANLAERREEFNYQLGLNTSASSEHFYRVYLRFECISLGMT